MNQSSNPYYRGSADKWYGRSPEPHYYDDQHNRITDLTPEQIAAYYEGFDSHDDTPGRGGKDFR